MTTENTTPAPADQQRPGDLGPIRTRPQTAPYTRGERTRARTAAWSRAHLVPILRRRGTEIEEALDLGWPFTALWLRVLGVFGGLGLFCVLGDWAGTNGLAAYHQLVGAHTHTGLAASVSHPVHAYLDQHSATLPMTGRNLFGLWELAGIVLLVAGFLGSTVARLGYLLFGAATAAMVWTQTPGPARPVATAIAVALWGVGAFVVLRNLSLRPVRVTNIDARPQVVLPPQPATTVAGDAPDQ